MEDVVAVLGVQAEGELSKWAGGCTDSSVVVCIVVEIWGGLVV